MIGKINEFRDSLKILKDIESKLTNVDMGDPTEMLKNLGIDVDELEDNFNSQYDNQKIVLNYVFDSDNTEPEYIFN